MLTAGQDCISVPFVKFALVFFCAEMNHKFLANVSLQLRKLYQTEGISLAYTAQIVVTDRRKKNKRECMAIKKKVRQYQRINSK